MKDVRVTWMSDQHLSLCRHPNRNQGRDRDLSPCNHCPVHTIQTLMFSYRAQKVHKVRISMGKPDERGIVSGMTGLFKKNAKPQLLPHKPMGESSHSLV